MPLVAGKKHVRSSSTCLPVPPRCVSVGSHTSSFSSFAPSFTYGVTSTLNGVLPPSCGTSVASCPFTNTCARKSTRSKLRIVRKPFFGWTVNVRRYQIWSSGSTFRRTPESGVSTPNGTRIVPSYFVGRSETADVIA